jgi:hypothetical protein
MADKLTPGQQQALDEARDAKIRKQEDKAYEDSKKPYMPDVLKPLMRKNTTPYSPPSGALSNEEAAEFVRQMQSGKPTKEQEYKEFTRQVPEKKYAKGGSIRGGGIESRGKTKGRFV